MQIIINIPDELYETIKSDEYGVHQGRIYDIIRSGTPLSKGHERLIYEPTKEEIEKTVDGQNDFAELELVIKIPNDIYHRVVVSPRCATFLDAFRDRDMFIKALQTSTPLPKGHGRLIDADALEEKMCDREEELGDDKALWESSAVSTALDMFAPTIIEADKVEKTENEKKETKEL